MANKELSKAVISATSLVDIPYFLTPQICPMQPDFDRFISNILTDVEVTLQRHIKNNFRQGAFYGEPWPPKRAYPGSRAKLLYRNGILQDSVIPLAYPTELAVKVHTSLPYAALHNEGGQITVTAKMKRFFWAMHLKAKKALGVKKDGTPRANKANARLSQEAEYWKAMALMKVGKRITIPKRQFVGHHTQLDAAIERIVNQEVQEGANAIMADLQARINAGQAASGGATQLPGKGTRGNGGSQYYM